MLKFMQQQIDNFMMRQQMRKRLCLICDNYEMRLTFKFIPFILCVVPMIFSASAQEGRFFQLNPPGPSGNTAKMVIIGRIIKIFRPFCFADQKTFCILYKVVHI